MYIVCKVCLSQFEETRNFVESSYFIFTSLFFHLLRLLLLLPVFYLAQQNFTRCTRPEYFTMQRKDEGDDIHGEILKFHYL